MHVSCIGHAVKIKCERSQSRDHVWACSYVRTTGDQTKLLFQALIVKNNKLESIWMDERREEHDSISWFVPYILCCSVLRLYCIGFHFHKTKAERTKD